MNIVCLKNACVYDPLQHADGQKKTLWIGDDRIIDEPSQSLQQQATVIDLEGAVTMAGALDIHSHIAGGNVNTARLMLPDQHRNHLQRNRLKPFHNAKWSSFETGYRYTEMGYSMVLEPAMLPINAPQVHAELADIPIIDTAALAVLGSDDFLVRLLRADASQNQINDYVSWTMNVTKALGLKVINAGGSQAFKKGVETFGLDDTVPDYGISSRTLLQKLQTAVVQTGLPHPVHVHCNNLGTPGNIQTIVDTMEAAQGLPMHLAHVQFYGYGDEGKYGFSSSAAKLMTAFNRHPNITMDVGQVLFGQTVTLSGDVMAQFDRRHDASPQKWHIWHAENEGSGGIVPYQYKSASFINGLQWAIGLEIFLLCDDPWRLFFTTDHPNGAPFTRYPDLLRLLMDYDYRMECLCNLHPDIAEMTLLKEIKREYSLNDIAIMTRAAPSKLLGQTDRGHLKPGAKADIAIYREQADKAAMFRRAEKVFKNGQLVLDNGEIMVSAAGKTLALNVGYDRNIEGHIQDYFDRFYSLRLSNYGLAKSEATEARLQLHNVHGAFSH
ncbi:Formylmethanofuran dehydrogenase subunit A [Methylophaga frappieri]|uniref:Formylmethanofuran dehydrogenase subunit A n=1 Tax=Methylophaga frappieri (strain ATCC BAA-2434 / DSM 25690 / JAM7) TaxID=754477 RepID=I1YG87_METFJ|nr:formylmethanofuran dehydrogenase subunit A [Methylophaga frappieri]AFJ01930.1 Formylmethanofuran dehydrogenase subunit A [Methylophaga frappieri]